MRKHNMGLADQLKLLVNTTVTLFAINKYFINDRMFKVYVNNIQI